MGTRGPAPTPTKILDARGSPWKNRERRGKKEPKPRAGSPKRPAWLPSRCWSDWSRLIHDIAPGLVTTVDRNALARYVVLLDQWKTAMAWIDEHGTTYEEKRVMGATTKGAEPEMVVVGHRQYPQVKEAMGLVDAMLRLEKEFGLTPAARARLIAPEKEQAKTGAAKYAIAG